MYENGLALADLQCYKIKPKATKMLTIHSSIKYIFFYEY